ncbi:MAG: serine/threonine protein phosphatase [Bacteroidales bacterium]|nr:serine/threonine protein phosphatase [Bacteroidales bacterium]MBN2698384.1 serine/threonine protein phosphatase [Bacteroidales bacterium]
MGGYFIIGDIHGEIRLLDRLLEEISRYGPEKLIFLGDYIDRGPHSKPVIDRLMNLDVEAVFLLGNHELMMLNALENMAYGHSPIELWYYNGAEATLQSFNSAGFYSFQSDLKGKYLDFFRSLKLNYLLELPGNITIMITHAGISPAIPLADQISLDSYADLNEYILKKHLDPGDSFIWVRDQFFNSRPEFWKNHIVVHGHTPVNKLFRFVYGADPDEWKFFGGDICIRYNLSTGCPVSIDIDSGSTISGRLSALGVFYKDGTVLMEGITVSAGETSGRNLWSMPLPGKL